MGIRTLDDLQNESDTNLGEDDLRLSGGQRHRVAIAWTLLEDADLLILDEVTNDLDSYLEEHVHSGTETMEHEYAIIAISHRFSTVSNANLIQVVEEGKIREVGTHPGLIRQKGKYEDYTPYSRKRCDGMYG